MSLGELWKRFSGWVGPNLVPVSVLLAVLLLGGLWFASPIFHGLFIGFYANWSFWVLVLLGVAVILFLLTRGYRRPAVLVAAGGSPIGGGHAPSGGMDGGVGGMLGSPLAKGILGGIAGAGLMRMLGGGGHHYGGGGGGLFGAPMMGGYFGGGPMFGGGGGYGMGGEMYEEGYEEGMEDAMGGGDFGD